jgi:hypothetical protein
MTMINVKYNHWIPIAGELLGSKSLQVPAVGYEDERPVTV